VAVVSMSKQEFSRLEVLLRVQSGRLRVADACVLIGLQRRQVFRLLRGLKQDGATSLLSKRRGKPSNHQLPAEVRTLALSIVRERYADFGPTLAAEKLAEPSRLLGLARDLARLDDRRWAVAGPSASSPLILVDGVDGRGHRPLHGCRAPRPFPLPRSGGPGLRIDRCLAWRLQSR
jgi:hypothetical protein